MSYAHVGKGVEMERTTIWHVDVFLSEDGERTNAEAILRTSDGAEFRHAGDARRNPKDISVARIGEELATARALSGLVHDLLETTTNDIEHNVRVHLK